MILEGLKNITSDKERDKAIRLWLLLHEGKLTELADKHFDKSTAEVYFNNTSDFVFMIDDEYQTIAKNDNGELDLWINLEGKEGFLDDLIEMFKDGEIEKDDHEQLRNYLNDTQKEELANIFAEAKI